MRVSVAVLLCSLACLAVAASAQDEPVRLESDGPYHHGAPNYDSYEGKYGGGEYGGGYGYGHEPVDKICLKAKTVTGDPFVSGELRVLYACCHDPAAAEVLDCTYTLTDSARRSGVTGIDEEIGDATSTCTFNAPGPCVPPQLIGVSFTSSTDPEDQFWLKFSAGLTNSTSGYGYEDTYAYAEGGQIKASISEAAEPAYSPDSYNSYAEVDATPGVAIQIAVRLASIADVLKGGLLDYTAGFADAEGNILCPEGAGTIPAPEVADGKLPLVVCGLLKLTLWWAPHHDYTGYDGVYQTPPPGSYHYGGYGGEYGAPPYGPGPQYPPRYGGPYPPHYGPGPQHPPHPYGPGPHSYGPNYPHPYGPGPHSYGPNYPHPYGPGPHSYGPDYNSPSNYGPHIPYGYPGGDGSRAGGERAGDNRAAAPGNDNRAAAPVTEPAPVTQPAPVSTPAAPVQKPTTVVPPAASKPAAPVTTPAAPQQPAKVTPPAASKPAAPVTTPAAPQQPAKVIPPAASKPAAPVTTPAAPQQPPIKQTPAAAPVASKPAEKVIPPVTKPAPVAKQPTPAPIKTPAADVQKPQPTAPVAQKPAAPVVQPVKKVEAPQKVEEKKTEAPKVVEAPKKAAEAPKTAAPTTPPVASKTPADSKPNVKIVIKNA